MAENKVYCDIKEIAESELKKLVKKGDLSAAEMEAAKNTLSTILKATEICDRKDMEEEWSQRGYSHGEEPYRRWELLSYGNRRMMPYQSMGDYYDGGSMRNYSRHSIKDRAISRLEKMMDESGSDYERDKIREFIRHLEMMSE